MAKARVREGHRYEEVTVERNGGEVKDGGHPEKDVEEFGDAHELSGDGERALERGVEVEIYEALERHHCESDKQVTHRQTQQQQVAGLAQSSHEHQSGDHQRVPEHSAERESEKRRQENKLFHETEPRCVRQVQIS